MQRTDIPMRAATTAATNATDYVLHARRFVAGLLAIRLDWVRGDPIEGGVRISIPDSVDTTGAGAVLQWRRREVRALDFAITQETSPTLYDVLAARAERVEGWAETTSDGTSPTIYVRLALAPIDRDAPRGSRIDEDADAG